MLKLTNDIYKLRLNIYQLLNKYSNNYFKLKNIKIWNKSIFLL